MKEPQGDTSALDNYIAALKVKAQNEYVATKPFFKNYMQRVAQAQSTAVWAIDKSISKDAAIVEALVLYLLSIDLDYYKKQHDEKQKLELKREYGMYSEDEREEP